MTALEIVEQYYNCFNRKDWTGMLALLAAGIRHEVNQGEARIGIDRYRAFLAHMDECYDEQLADMVFFYGAGRPPRSLRIHSTRRVQKD